MPRSYRHILDYEQEILELKAKGYTHSAIGETLGFSYEQVRGFFKRRYKKQRIEGSKKSSHKRGRPCKKEGELPPSIQRLDKLTQMRYVMASKDRYIKRLEMENELMRDFLSLTERK
jgi:hypothetical protein